MTYYIGLKLKEKTLIAADRRVSMHVNGTMQVRDDFSKIGKISQNAYFSGAGDMNACGEIFSYLKRTNLKFPEEILHVDVAEIIRIHNKHIQHSRELIPNFEIEKEAHGYLNLSIIVGGINKERKPAIFFLNNLNGFVPQSVPSGTATNMGVEVNKFSNEFFMKFSKDFSLMNENSDNVIQLLKELFNNISSKDDSVSSVFDVMIVDNNGVDTLKRYKS